MKIQLLSDLHLEAHPHWSPTPAPGADVLVLAGDIGSYQKGSLLNDADFGLARFSPLRAWPTPVVFVPGNHEYDGLEFEATHTRLRACCDRLGLMWLEREAWVTPWQNALGEPVRLLGTTLWTDFDALTPRAPAPAGKHLTNATSLLTQQLKARDKAFRAANYYLRKTETTVHGTALLAEQVRALGLACQDWLQRALQVPFQGSTVVVTHFAPSLQSADPRYGLTPGTAGFCNALDDWLEHAELWLHGHLHAPSDYVHRGCRVVANPLGYARKNEQGQFNAQGIIEI